MGICPYSSKTMRGKKSTNGRYVAAIIALVSLCFVGFVYAGKTKQTQADVLPVPRFVTLASNEVNLRVGPGVRYPIKLVFKKEGLPVEIIKEFDVWRQIRSFDGEKGWVHQSLLSGKRGVIIKGAEETIYKDPGYNAKPVVKLEQGVIAALGGCHMDWCQLKVAGYKGWIEKQNIWGVYPDEIVAK